LTNKYPMASSGLRWPIKGVAAMRTLMRILLL
jgi:hypothetical protein